MISFFFGIDVMLDGQIAGQVALFVLNRADDGPFVEEFVVLAFVDELAMPSLS